MDGIDLLAPNSGTKVARCQRDPSRVQRVREVLTRYGILEEAVIDTVMCLIAHRGLFVAPQPRPGTTARDIQRAARAAGSPLERVMIESQTFQTIRGQVIVPRGHGGGRRPEPEITHAAQLLDAYLQQQGVGRRDRRRRHACIAALLAAAVGRAPEPGGAMRKRLDRARPAFDFEVNYELEVWRSEDCRWLRDRERDRQGPDVGTRGTTAVPERPPFPLLTGDALRFLKLHERAHTYLRRWGLRRLAQREEIADEFAAAFLLLKEQDEAMLPAARPALQWWSGDDGDRRAALRARNHHAPSADRARRTLRVIDDDAGAFVQRWRRILTPTRRARIWRRCRRWWVLGEEPELSP